MSTPDTDQQPSWGWMTYAPHNGIIHVMPINDDHEHEFSENCWCGAELDDFNVMTHNSNDGREDYEDGIRKPH